MQGSVSAGQRRSSNYCSHGRIPQCEEFCGHLEQVPQATLTVVVDPKELGCRCGLPGRVQQAHTQAGMAGVKAAVCEMPFARISSDVAGGAGGTCVLRGCVPKKLMVYGGEFAQAFKDSVGFGCASCCFARCSPARRS